MRDWYRKSCYCPQMWHKSCDFVGYSYKLELMRVIIIAYTVDKIRLIKVHCLAFTFWIFSSDSESHISYFSEFDSFECLVEKVSICHTCLYKLYYRAQQKDTNRPPLLLCDLTSGLSWLSSSNGVNTAAICQTACGWRAGLV